MTCRLVITRVPFDHWQGAPELFMINCADLHLSVSSVLLSYQENWKKREKSIGPSRRDFKIPF